jgi:hypothetical protein
MVVIVRRVEPKKSVVTTDEVSALVEPRTTLDGRVVLGKL